MLLGMLPVPLTGFGVGKVNYHQLWIGDWSLQNWFEILFNGFMKLVLRGIVLSDVMLPREISPVRDDNNQSRHLWSFIVSQDVKVGKKKKMYLYMFCMWWAHRNARASTLQSSMHLYKGKRKPQKKPTTLKRLAYRNTRMNILFLTFKRKHHWVETTTKRLFFPLKLNLYQCSEILFNSNNASYSPF